MRIFSISALTLGASLGLASATMAQTTRSDVFEDLQRAAEAHRNCVTRQARARAVASRAEDRVVIREVTALCATQEKNWAALAARNARSAKGDPVVIQRQIARQAYLNAEDEVRSSRGKPVRPDHN